jgi:hypothetical protein
VFIDKVFAKSIQLLAVCALTLIGLVANPGSDLDGEFTDYNQSRNTRQTQSIGTNSNRILGFSQTRRLYTEEGSTASTTQVTYSLDQNGNLTGDGLKGVKPPFFNLKWSNAA